MNNSDVSDGGSTITSQQVVQFVDEGVQQQVSVPVVKDTVSAISEMQDVTLGSWLERPLEIANYTWTSGSSLSAIFDPWSLFMEDPRNINKIAYFNNFKCDHLCLKFLINGGPFYYGRVLVSYLPLASAVISGLTDNTSFYATTAPNIESTLITHTHRPHIILDPTLSQGGCFELPFIWYKNWISIPTKEWGSMGNVSLQSFGTLGSAGGVTSSSVRIKVFAWMEKPRLAVPTTSLPTLPAQSTAGDEYVGLVSKKASALASMAGRLVDFPVIGPYARASEIGAGALASMAKLFGFSRPNVLSHLVPMRPTFVNDIAVVDKPEYVIKITTDSKQELSIAQDHFGVDVRDPFSIAGLVGRETYLCSSTWAITAAEGVNLFSSVITPMLYGLYTPPGYTLNKTMVNTAMSYGSLPFRYWHGNVKFRFQLVASQYHRGRIKIVYDIAAAPIATKSNSVYSRIIDIQETTEFTVTIGWNNPAVMLPVNSSSVLSLVQNWTVNGAALVPNTDYHNGSLTMFVENELMVPIPGVSADATWLVWVSLENPVFNEPSTLLQQVTPSPPFVATSGDDTEGGPTDSLMVGDLGLDANINQVCFGETIMSYRALLRRYTDYLTATASGTSASIYSYFTMIFRDYPLYPGSDPGGINTTSTSVATNFVGMSFINYLSMSHSAYRGGIRYKFSMSSAGAFRLMEFLRYPSTTGSTRLNSTQLATANVDNEYAANAAKLGNAWIGAAISDGVFQPFLESEAPFWYNLRFLNPKTFINNNYVMNATQFLSMPFSGNGKIALKVYISAAEDFQLSMYTGPPVLWLSSYNSY